jgi:hypothetical protein
MEITSNKKYNPGDKVICIISSNTNLESGKEYTVKKYTYEYGDNLVSLEEEQEYTFNVGRFISTMEIRDSKINKILNNE